MTRPGDRLRHVASRVCSERNRRRFVEPAIADLQAEFAAARRGGSRWLALRALAAGYLSVGKVVIIATCGDLRDEARTWQPEERAGARRGALVAIGAATLVASMDRAAVGAGWAAVVGATGGAAGRGGTGGGVKALLAAATVPPTLGAEAAEGRGAVLAGLPLDADCKEWRARSSAPPSSPAVW